MTYRIVLCLTDEEKGTATCYVLFKDIETEKKGLKALEKLYSLLEKLEKALEERCQTCKYSEYEYNWHYEWSVRVCKHPKRHKIEWDVDWGFLTDCPFWKPKRQNFEEKSTKKMEADNP